MDFEKGCEECGIENELLFNTITDNKAMRLCQRCAYSSNSLILEEEIQKQKARLEIKKQEKEKKVEPIQTKVPSMNDLWARYKIIKAKREQEKKTKEAVAQKIVVLEEKRFIEDLDKEKNLEKKELLEEINKDIIPEQREMQSEEPVIADSTLDFSMAATKRIKLKNLLKGTLKFLKGKNKKEEDKQENIQEEIINVE